jgi:hypothetical protein
VATRLWRVDLSQYGYRLPGHYPEGPLGFRFTEHDDVIATGRAVIVSFHRGPLLRKHAPRPSAPVRIAFLDPATGSVQTQIDWTAPAYGPVLWRADDGNFLVRSYDRLLKISPERKLIGDA